jgi:predicted kinase
MQPLRCHLLIGPPASGKSTLAHTLAPLLAGPGDPPGVVISTDQLREEVFGDAAVQGPWEIIEPLLHERIAMAVAAGRPVIVDATHARRPWRQAITQTLDLPAPAEWIGWWLCTPLAICLERNRRRPCQVSEEVIRELAGALADPEAGPWLEEGFAALVRVDPSSPGVLTPLLLKALADLDQNLGAGTNLQGPGQRRSDCP